MMVTASFNDRSWGTLSARRLKRSGLKQWISISRVLRAKSWCPPGPGPEIIETTWSYEKHNEWTLRNLTIDICRWRYGMAADSQDSVKRKRRNERDWSSGKRTRHHSWLKNSSVMPNEDVCRWARKSNLRCRSCDWWASKNNWWPTRLVNSKPRNKWEISRLLRYGMPCCMLAKINDISTSSRAANFNDRSVVPRLIRRGSSVLRMSSSVCGLGWKL